MESLKDRLLFALNRSNKSQAELARLIGIKQPSVQQLCSGKTKRTKYLYEISEALNVNPEWLATGRGHIEPDSPVASSSEGRLMKIPILSLSEINLWLNNKSSSALSNKDTEYYFTFFNGGKKSYAILVEEDSMNNPYGSPSIPNNSLIIVDPSFKPQNHSIVIAKLSSKEKIIRMYVREGGRVYLKPLNPRYPILCAEKNVSFCGTVKKIELNLPSESAV